MPPAIAQPIALVCRSNRMFRTRGAVALVVAAALGAAACGGTDWNAARKPKPLSAAQVRAAAAAQKKAETPYVNALVVKYRAIDNQFTDADQQCFAAAVVHGLGVTAFTSHGLTANGLRNPRTTLDDLPTPTLPQVAAIGAAMQRCHLSALGAAVAQGLAVTDAKTVDCLSRALSRPQARRFLVLSLFGRRQMTLVTAHSVVGLFASCVDLAELVLRSIDLGVDPSIHACVLTALHGVEPQLEDVMALNLSHADRDQIEQAAVSLNVAINQCRPGARTGFTVPPS
jgi:hypothetical protein